MSTKIYQGFMMWTTDIVTIKDRVDRVRPKIARLSHGLLDSFLSSARQRGPKTDDPLGPYGLWLDIRRKSVDVGIRNPCVDTQFDLTFIPVVLDGSQPGRYITLGICYTEHEAWFQEWLRIDGVKEYGYWDNTDKPDALSCVEWEERKRRWGQVNIPAMDGFTISVVDPGGPTPTFEEIGD
jgi:hypothetical protein